MGDVRWAVLLAVSLIFRDNRPDALPPLAKREEDAPPAVWAVDVRGPDVWWSFSSPGRSAPSKPFPEQKKPPCVPPHEVEIAGGCWLFLGSPAPCGPTAFEHAGRCYIPVRLMPREPSSWLP